MNVTADRYAKSKSERQRAINLVLESSSRNKIVVAGPGKGKTSLLKEILEHPQRDVKERPVQLALSRRHQRQPAGVGRTKSQGLRHARRPARGDDARPHSHRYRQRQSAEPEQPRSGGRSPVA